MEAVDIVRSCSPIQPLFRAVHCDFLLSNCSFYVVCECVCLHECELDLLFVLLGSEAVFVIPLFNLYKVGVNLNSWLFTVTNSTLCWYRF